MKRWLVGPLLAAALPVGAACPAAADAGAMLAEGPVQLHWRAQPMAIIVGQPFALHVTLCPESAQLLAADATMPEHRHGMNYRPSITSLGEGRWRAEGLLWHMSGRWELALDVQHAGARHRLRQSVVLP